MLWSASEACQVVSSSAQITGSSWKLLILHIISFVTVHIISLLLVRLILDRFKGRIDDVGLKCAYTQALVRPGVHIVYVLTQG